MKRETTCVIVFVLLPPTIESPARPSQRRRESVSSVHHTLAPGLEHNACIFPEPNRRPVRNIFMIAARFNLLACLIVPFFILRAWGADGPRR